MRRADLIGLEPGHLWHLLCPGALYSRYIYSSKHEPQLYLPLTLADVLFHPNQVARSEIQLWGLGEKMQLCALSAGLARDLPRSWAGAAAGFPCPPPSISPRALQGGGGWARAEGRGPDSLNNILS